MIRRPLSLLLAIALCGCAQQPGEQRVAAQRDLLTEAFVYRVCVSSVDRFTWSDCERIKRSLDLHLAAFKARYAPGY